MGLNSCHFKELPFYARYLFHTSLQVVRQGHVISLLMGSGTSQFPFSSFLSILLVFLSLILINAWIVSGVAKGAFLPTLSCL